MIPRWNLASALDALLDALEADLLGASSEEVQAALGETGRAREGAVGEIRWLLHDTKAEDHDHYHLALPPDEHDGIDSKQH